jgi:uncharacterized protein
MSPEPVDPEALIDRFYPPGDPAREILREHGFRVTDLALEIADRAGIPGLDRAFIAEAAPIHDIGIGRTFAPGIGCRGPDPYIRHGIIGRELLDAIGLDRHARVCECHVGAGLTIAEIDRQNLPLPRREMLPVSVEEMIIAYADKFHSKSGGGRYRTVSDVRARLLAHGPHQAARFDAWVARFGPPHFRD